MKENLGSSVEEQIKYNVEAEGSVMLLAMRDQVSRVTRVWHKVALHKVDKWSDERWIRDLKQVVENRHARQQTKNTLRTAKLVAELKEACATIRKAMVQINELHAAGGSAQNFNQMTRWVMTKEEHCGKIIKIMSEYALCQRVKPEVFSKPEDYVDALKAHHAVMQSAMKAKQTVDAAGADALEHAVGDMSKMYLKD